MYKIRFKLQEYPCVYTKYFGTRPELSRFMERIARNSGAIIEITDSNNENSTHHRSTLRSKER
jgi:hypothetical protein